MSLSVGKRGIRHLLCRKEEYRNTVCPCICNPLGGCHEDSAESFRLRYVGDFICGGRLHGFTFFVRFMSGGSDKR